MTEHLAEVHQRKEPLATLWASESSIYGRFGYGPATERATMKIDQHFAKLRQPPDIAGTMRLVDLDEALDVFPQVYERVARATPGCYLRSDHWWRNRVLSDPEIRRHGASAHRRVLHLRDGQPVGYVIYRTRVDRSADTAELVVVELTGIDAEAQKSLWQYVFSVDLIDTIKYWNQPVDDPLRWWIEEPRRMERHVSDSLWVRPVDVVACLNQRRYVTAGSIAFRFRDEVCPWNDGQFCLQVDDEGVGHCQPHCGDVELELTPFTLGAAYLGGHRLRDLARSGLLSGSNAALQQADELLAWDPLPWCQEIF